MRSVPLLPLCLAIVVVSCQAASRRPVKPTPAPEDEDEFVDECPEANGFFADAYQCDKYYECREGEIIEKLCPDGMVFNDFSPAHEKCDLPFNIDCSQRPERQEPRPTQHCPRLNGYFAHEDESICDKFYYCVDGKFNMITCPDGLVYNERTGICTWPDEAKKKGCSSKDVFQFDCPSGNNTQKQQHPRYADPADCQFFYVCINSEIPRRNGCSLGQVFNDVTKTCDSPKNVPECEDWYKGVLDEEEEKPKPKPTSSSSGTRNSAPKRKGRTSGDEPQKQE